jgi:YD repeat-containing protein
MRCTVCLALGLIGSISSASAWACSIQFTSPADGAVVNTPNVGVSGSASGFANPGAVGSASATVNGRVFFRQTGTFTALLNFFGSGSAAAGLDRGVNTLKVTGSVSGCSASDTITVIYEPPPDQPNPPKDNGRSPDPLNCGAANPCNPSTGNKYQREVDYAGSGELALRIERYYNSSFSVAGTIGANWTAPWDRRVMVASTTATRASLSRADGKLVIFSLVAGVWKADADVNERLAEIRTGALRTGWMVITSDNEIETYDADGKLLSVASAAGKRQTLTYSDATTPATRAPGPGLVIRIADTFGRAINLTYDAQGRVSSITDPDEQLFEYGYDEEGNLVSVQAPFIDASRTLRRYLYGEPAHINAGLACPAGARAIANLLTGIQDEAGVRFGTYKYDCTGKVVSSEHAGGIERFTFAYTLKPNGAPASTTITDPRGTVHTRTYQTTMGVARGMSNAKPCVAPGCAGDKSTSASRDPNGNLSELIDFNGFTTQNTFDLTRNLETRRTEAFGTPVARTISTEWHPDWRLPIRKAEPGRIVTTVYNGQPDPLSDGAMAACAPADARLPNGRPIAVLCRQVEHATTDRTGAMGFDATLQIGVPAREIRRTYNAAGQVLSEDGPRTDVNDVTTYAYHLDTTSEHTLGDLQSITNAKAHAVQFPRYNRHGQVLQSIDANGVQTQNTYDLRQRTLSVAVVDEVTRYSYDLIGQLKRVTFPDDSHIGFEYDLAHRRVSAADSRGHRTEYVLDNASQLIRQKSIDPSGSLRRQLSRVIDALGRLQQNTGRE